MDRMEELRRQFLSEPLAQFLGLTLDDLGPGLSAISMTPRPETLIVSGIVQGGITAALADYAGVYAAMASIPAGFTPAVNVNVNLFRPIPGGEKVTAKAAIVNATKSSVLTEVRIDNDNGKLMAHGTIQFAKPRP
jgi:acyl-CoA thioesterase